MMAILARSRVPPDQVAEILEARHRVRLGLRRRREVGAATARQELAAGIEHLRLRGGKLAAEPDHLAARVRSPGMAAA